MIEHILIAALICNPDAPGRTIVYPVETLNSVASKFIPGSEALSNSVLRADALAACATVDACLQRMIIPRLSMYGGERNVSLGSLYAEDMGLFRPSTTNYGVYGKAWFQGFSVYEDTNLNYFIPASNRVFKSRIGARLRDYVEDFIFGSTNGNGRTQFDDMGSFRWIDPTVNHASLVRSGWKRDDMLDTADWSRYLRALSEFNPAGTGCAGRFCPDHHPDSPFDPLYQVPGLLGYMIEGGFPVIERKDMTGEEPKLIDLVYSRCHVRTNGIASASGRLSYDRMAMANGIISLCDTSLHAGRTASFYSRDDEGMYSVTTDSSHPGYRFLQKSYTLRKSASLVCKISEDAELLIGNVPGSDNQSMWKFVHYFPSDSDFEGEPSLSQSCDVTSVVTNFVDNYKVLNVWTDVEPIYGVSISAIRPLRFNELYYNADGITTDEPYYLFVKLTIHPTSEENPDKNVTRTLSADLWAGRMTSDGYPVPEHKIGTLNISNLSGWKGSVTFFYSAETRGVETVEKRPFIGPTYINTPDDQATNFWEYSVNPYLPKDDVFELVERADGYSFHTLAVNTNHKDIAEMAINGNDFSWGHAKDVKGLAGGDIIRKDTWAFFQLSHKSLGKPSGDSLTAFLTGEIYANIADRISEAYEMAPHADLKTPTFEAASHFDVSDIFNKFYCPVMLELWKEEPNPIDFRIRAVEDPTDSSKRILILEDLAGHSLPFDTVIYQASLGFGTSLPTCPGFRSVAVFCHEIPYFTMKWKFPSMRFSGEKSK